MGLEKFGVDAAALREEPLVPKRIFRCWVEPWEIALVGKNDAVAEARLLEKYRDIVFHDPDVGITYTAFDGKLEWRRGKTNGWCVLGIPPEWDGKSMDNLEPYVIRTNIIGEMVMDTEQPKRINVEVVKERPENEGSTDSEED